MSVLFWPGSLPNSLLGFNGINDELIGTEFTCHTNEIFLPFLSRCARWCQCQPITSLLAALWALCTFLQTALTSIGSGLLPAWMRKHLRDILFSWTLLNLWWVSLSHPMSLQRHFHLLSFMLMYKGPKKLEYLKQYIHSCLKTGFSLGCVLKASLFGVVWHK